MKVLIFGASGATGSQLLRHLIERNIPVRAVIRSGAVLPGDLAKHGMLELVHGNVQELDGMALTKLLTGCDCVAVCLGHRISLKGLFGPPWNLVSDLVGKLVDTIGTDGLGPARLVLMGTSGYTHPSLGEHRGLSERMINVLFGLLLPPHRDNCRAANRLLTDQAMARMPLEWVVVRPDSLTDNPNPVNYALHRHPIRSPFFDSGTVSRCNVGRFMADLLCDDALWAQWNHCMPVMYDQV